MKATLYVFFPSDWSVNKVLRWLQQHKELTEVKPESYWSFEPLKP